MKGYFQQTRLLPVLLALVSLAGLIMIVAPPARSSIAQETALKVDITEIGSRRNYEQGNGVVLCNLMPAHLS